MFFVFILTLLGMYLLFISTEKYRSPKSTGHFKSLAQKYYSLLRILAFLLFALSGFILIKNMVFNWFCQLVDLCNTLNLLLILWLNPLKPSKTSSKSSIWIKFPQAKHDFDCLAFCISKSLFMTTVYL